MRIPKTKVSALKPQTASQPTISVVQLQDSVGHVCMLHSDMKIKYSHTKMRKYLLTPEGKITETKTSWGNHIFRDAFFNLQIGLSTLPPLIPSLQHSHFTIHYLDFAFLILPNYRKPETSEFRILFT